MSQNALTTLPDTLTPTEVARIQNIATGINLNDPTLTVTYGTQTMSDISKFADRLLERVRAKDAGPVGETLTNLLVHVKEVNLSEIGKDKRGFLERIPFIGALFNSVERSMAKFQTLADQVENIGGKLEEAMIGLLRDIEILEQLYGHNKNYHQDLTIYIEAGKQKLAQARDVELPALQEAAAKSGDSMAAQNVRDFAEKINRFDRRLHDLQLSRTITLQTAPQIRLIQSNNQTLAEKIQTSILATIPIWKSQMVLALSLHGQREAAKLQKSVSDATNDMLKQNAEMLESATIETAREVERSVVDIETIRTVHGKLLNTIEETLRIAQEGRDNRRSVEKELETMEEELRTRLTSLAANKTEQSVQQALGKKDAAPALSESVATNAQQTK